MITALNHTKIQSQNLTLLGFGFVLVLVVLASLSLGAFSIPFPQTLAILFDQIGIQLGTFEVQQANVLLQIRMPRVLMAMLVGGGLGIAGAALQGMFRNPLVEPGLIGVSTGSALFAVIFMVLVPTVSSLAWIKTRNIVTPDEYTMSKDALKWAAMTYVVAALASMATLAYYIFVFFGNRD
jgi:iron complex transport system permease protein